MGARGPGGGRKPKPTVLKVLEGNPGKRPLNEAEPVPDGLPVKPDDLSGYAVEVWHRLIKVMPPGIYTGAESDVLARYCRACDLSKEASIKLSEEGVVNGGVVNPWMRVLNEQVKIIASLGSQLGCSPSARVNLKVPPAKVGSKFAGLIK